MSLKQRILTVAIAVMLALFIGFGIDTVYKPPKSEDFCKNQNSPIIEKTRVVTDSTILYYDVSTINKSFRLCEETSEICMKNNPNDLNQISKCLKESDICSNRILIGYLGNNYKCFNESTQTQADVDSCNEQKGYLTPKYDDKGCVESYYCETCFNAFEEADIKYNGVVFVAALILGILAMVVAIILKNDTVSPGILGGGFLAIVYGTLRDWQNLGDYLRLALLGVALAILIWIGYKKMTVDEGKTLSRKKK